MEEILLSHPDKLLSKHLINVCRIGEKKLNQISFNRELYLELGIELKMLNRIILVTHDFGKANRFFQKKIQLAKENPESAEFKKLKNDPKTSHGLLSAFFTYYILKQISKNPLVPIIGFMIVNKHHGNLKNIKDNFELSTDDWALLREQAESINIKFLEEILNEAGLDISLSEFSIPDLKHSIDNYRFRRKQLTEICKTTNLYIYFLVNLLYSILIYSDKGEVIFGQEGYPQEKIDNFLFKRHIISPYLVDNFRRVNGWDRPETDFDLLRNRVYQDINYSIQQLDLSERILSINVPTGIGKTVSSYAAALRLRDRLKEKTERYYRVIYTLPFTSVIDQNYKVMQDILKLEINKITGDLLTRHHYLSEKNYETDEKDNISYNVAEFLIESWNSEIVISTFVQLLESILTNNNRRIKKFNNICNSIIVLDEVQAIPHKYWLLVKRVFREMADQFDCYFIFVTATMPLIFNEEKGEIKELATDKVKYFMICDRIELDLSNYREEIDLDIFKKIIEADLKTEYPEKSFLFILNTIKSSIEIYNFIKHDLEYKNVIYLSKNLITKELTKRIEKIKNADEPLIVVSTQLVEAGVDIDFDRVYRDFAPLDSINQSCGRCNRNFDPEKKGKVRIFRLVDIANNRLYASYVYDPFLLEATKKILDNLPDIIGEKSFFKLNNDYFTLVDADKSNDQAIDLLKRIESLEYKKAFENAVDYEIFKLIKQKYDTIDLFIALDNNAINLWKKYTQLQDIKDPWARKMVFEDFREDFLGYVVTVCKTNVLRHFEEDDLKKGFNYISPEEVENVYDAETGFIQGEQIQYFI